jgi:recA bacterial DNA recombination protein
MPHPQAAALEAILEGRGLASKPAALALLSGLGGKLSRACDLPSRTAPRDTIPTRVDALDRLLHGGLPRGGLVELAGHRSTGRFSIGISALAAATSSGEAAALVDLGGHLDPQAAAAAGVELERLLWVRPEKLKAAVASAEMLLSTGFPLVVLDLGLAPVRGRFLPDAAWLRLARAARSRGAALFVLAPYRISGIAADAAISAGAARGVWKGAGRSPRLLDGLAARLALEKDGRARGEAVEEMALAAAG